MIQVMMANWNDNGCYYHRAVLPARYCAKEALEAGVRVHLIRKTNLDESNLDHFDVYVLHGMDAALNIPMIGRWKSQGKKFIWSIDDDYFCVPDHNAAKPNKTLLGALCIVRSLADEVWCSTHHLAEQTRRSVDVLVRVLPNLLDMKPYRVTSLKRRRVVRTLWFGTSTHNKDVESYCEAIRLISKHAKGAYKDRVEFVFYGMSPSAKTEQDHLWSEVSFVPFTTFNEFHSTLTSLAGDIGACPLGDDLFNRSKSNLKILEMAALRQAVIASPVGPYEAKLPGLIHAADGKAWCNEIVRLVEDEKHRADKASEIYEEVYSNWNWADSKCRKDWTEAFVAQSGVK